MKKTLFITGGSKGIGRSCVRLFLKNGFEVYNAARSNPGPPENEYYHFIKCDVSIESDIRNAVENVLNRSKKIDVLINNSGFGKFANLVDSKTEDFDEMFAVNVRGLYLCTRFILPSMIENKDGTIINISSIAGKNGVPTASIYSATKHAVMGLTKSLMAEVRQYNIRVIAICPGSVDTNFFDSEGAMLHSKRESILSPDDVAETCMLAVMLPKRAVMNEVEIRPNNPEKLQ
jgi:short-subunit dehydrogenase